jgi:hypothetical protein
MFLRTSSSRFPLTAIVDFSLISTSRGIKKTASSSRFTSDLRHEIPMNYVFKTENVWAPSKTP